MWWNRGESTYLKKGPLSYLLRPITASERCMRCSGDNHVESNIDILELCVIDSVKKTIGEKHRGKKKGVGSYWGLSISESRRGPFWLSSPLPLVVFLFPPPPLCVCVFAFRAILSLWLCVKERRSILFISHISTFFRGKKNIGFVLELDWNKLRGRGTWVWDLSLAPPLGSPFTLRPRR